MLSGDTATAARNESISMHEFEKHRQADGKKIRSRSKQL
jgi:hypothetical protein